MRKRKMLLLIICPIVALLLCATIFFLVTKGTVEEKDGLLQNSRVYMENVRYEDGTIYYTFVNKTLKTRTSYDVPWVQKKVDGEWQFVALTSTGASAFPYRWGAFEERQLAFTVDYPERLTPGEYRIFFGEVRAFDDGFRVYGDGTYTVGYFTIPAPENG